MKVVYFVVATMTRSEIQFNPSRSLQGDGSPAHLAAELGLLPVAAAAIGNLAAFAAAVVLERSAAVAEHGYGT